MEMVGAVSLSSWCSIPRTRGGGGGGGGSSVNLGFSSSLLCCNLKAGKVSVSVSSGRRRNKRGLTCNALFGLGVPELVVIAGVAAIVFGPKKLPEVGRSIGQTVKSFQQAAKEFESELKKEPDTTGGGSSEKPIALSEQEKQDTEVSSSKESV